MHRPLAAIVFAFGVAGMVSPAHATQQQWLMQATGYPKVLFTNGNPAASSWSNWPGQQNWAMVTSPLLTLSSSATINQFNFVASNVGGINLGSLQFFELHVWDSVSSFESNPLIGNIHMVTGHVGLFQQGFGSSTFGPSNYVEVDFEPFDLPAGEYLFAIHARVTPSNPWMIVESDINHGTGWMIGGSIPLTPLIDRPGWTTGIPAYDIGYTVGTCGLADLNCDGVVNVSDLLILLAAWGSCDNEQDCPADLNGDDTINVSDLLILLSNWG